MSHSGKVDPFDASSGINLLRLLIVLTVRRPGLGLVPGVEGTEGNSKVDHPSKYCLSAFCLWLLR